MTTLNERAQQGAEIRARFGGGTPSSGSVPGSRDMAPDLHRIADEALFGSIWRRPALKIEHREMIVLSVLTVLTIRSGGEPESMCPSLSYNRTAA